MQNRKLRSTPAVQFIQSIPSTWKGYELFAIWIVKKLKPKVTVDLGFDMGLSTISFAHGNRGHTFGIDWLSGNNYSRKRISMESALHNILIAIRLRYVKNLHLIVGPIPEISHKWNSEIDLLHIDSTQSYEEIKKQYMHWQPFLKKDAVILIHDVTSLPSEVGRFFEELPLYKFVFTKGCGLGIATSNETLCQEIEKDWANQPF